VPALLAAREQLLAIEGVMQQDAGYGRSMMRSGPFGGIRDNCRAIGEYAVLGGMAEADVAKVVKGFFTATEKLDNDLFEAARNDNKLPASTPEDFKKAVAALDGVIALVPKEIVDQSQKILDAIRAPSPDDASSVGNIEKLL
jgi:hypothetical protein